MDLGITLTNTRVGVGSFQLAIPEFRLDPGSITYIQGPNGCGKTTLGRAILGDLEFDHSFEPLPSRGTTGYVPQNYRESLLPWLTGEQNLSLLDTPLDELMIWADKMGLSRSELTRRPFRLSGGQCQRIAYIRECAIEPNYLILDEPFSSLDVHTVPIAGELLVEMLERGTAVQLISHTLIPDNIKKYIKFKYTIYRDSDTSARIENS